MKKEIIIGVVLLAAGYGLGRYVQPAKVVTKTEVVTKVETQIQEHVHTITRTITDPNGHSETVTVTDNNTNTHSNSESDSTSSTVTTYNKPQWKAQGLVGLNIHDLSSPVYGVGVERRILGPIFVGAYGKTNSEAGLSVSLEF